MPLIYDIPMFSILLVLMSAMGMPCFSILSWGLILVRGVEVGVAALSAVLLVQLSESGESFTYQMGHFPAPWGNLLRCGPLEALLALVFSLVMILSLCAGAEDIRRDVRADRQGSYCVLMQLLFGALLAMIYTDDLFTAYVFIEIAAVTACMAVVAKESGRSVVSAIRYLIFSCLGSGLVLLGIALLYCITGQLLFSSLEQAVLELVASPTYTLPLVVSALLMTLGLSIKSAQFPFHAWLPDAHASATTASSAVLSGLVLKGYLIILLKLILRVYGPSLLATTYMDDLLFLLGLTGMLFASVAALRPNLLHFLGVGPGDRRGTHCRLLPDSGPRHDQVHDLLRGGSHDPGQQRGTLLESAPRSRPAGTSGRTGLHGGRTVPVRSAPVGGLFRQILSGHRCPGRPVADRTGPLRPGSQFGAQRHVLYPRHPGHLGPGRRRGEASLEVGAGGRSGAVPPV